MSGQNNFVSYDFPGVIPRTRSRVMGPGKGVGREGREESESRTGGKGEGKGRKGNVDRSSTSFGFNVALALQCDNVLLMTSFHYP